MGSGHRSEPGRPHHWSEQSQLVTVAGGPCTPPGRDSGTEETSRATQEPLFVIFESRPPVLTPSVHSSLALALSPPWPSETGFPDKLEREPLPFSVQTSPPSWEGL